MEQKISRVENSPCVLVIGGEKQKRDTKNDKSIVEVSLVETLDLVNKTWTTSKSLTSKRSRRVNAVTLNGKVYVVGLAQNGTSVERYDPSSDTWATLGNLQEQREEAEVVVVNDVMYALLGYKERCEHSSIEKYEINGDYWSKDLAPMATDEHRVTGWARAVAFQNKIYVTEENTMQVYDPSVDT